MDGTSNISKSSNPYAPHDVLGVLPMTEESAEHLEKPYHLISNSLTKGPLPYPKHSSI